MTILASSFSELSDFRIERSKLHDLKDILFICICGSICGEDDYVGIWMWACDNEAWLRRHLELKNGIPSHDTLMRVFRHLDYEEFSKCFVDFTSRLCELTSGEVVSIDGKCLCGSEDRRLGKKGIYMVGAWAEQNELLLGQVKVDEKSNEITAIPKLLDLLCIQGCTITIDAMGCQKEIAKAIVEKEANYVLAVKQNQKNLHEQIMRSFHSEKAGDSFTTTEKNHGRIEVRTCEVITDLKWIEEKMDWANLNSIVKVTASRTIVSENKQSEEVRYFICNQAFSAQKMLHAVRSHWGIENKLHWSLDVTFNEDNNRNRKDFAPANFSFVQRIALNLLKKETSKISLKHKRNRANRNNEFLQKILRI
ncbi:MAG: ISAs1 family transposase [Bacteroidia bacterium]|nr:ISAs1 family transposase [Bacteroidia bacterium]